MTTPSSSDSPANRPNLTAADIRQLALANLEARAREGGKLSADDWARLEAFEASARPDPVAEALGDLAEHVAAIKAKGSRPPASLVRLLRDAALARNTAACWADVAAAARELGVSVQTARNWCDELGIPANRAAISRADLYRALWLRERDKAAPGSAAISPADAREQELRMAERQARIDARTRRLVAEANDAAKAGVIAAVRDVRSTLAARLPALLADHLASGDRLAWEGQARRLILDLMTSVCADLASAETTGPAPADIFAAPDPDPEPGPAADEETP